MEDEQTITVSVNRLTIHVNEFETDLKSLERLLEMLTDSVGTWLDFERSTQRHCPRCNVHHRLYECHDLEQCPYCHRIIQPAKNNVVPLCRRPLVEGVAKRVLKRQAHKK